MFILFILYSFYQFYDFFLIKLLYTQLKILCFFSYVLLVCGFITVLRRVKKKIFNMCDEQSTLNNIRFIYNK